MVYFGSLDEWFFEGLIFYERVMVVIILGIIGIIIIGRIVLAAGYNGELGIISMQIRGIKTRDDIEKLANNTFGRIVKEYAGLGARGIGKIDTAAIGKLMTYRSRLVFFNYQSLGRFIAALDGGILPLGILFAIAAQNRLDMAIVAGGAFAAAKVFGGIFDFEMAAERYAATISHVLSRDIARFFPIDATSAIIALSKDMKQLLERQNTLYNEVLGKISSDFTEQMKVSIKAMTHSVEMTMNSIAHHEGLEAALGRWRDAVDVAGARQLGAAQTIDKLEKTLADFNTAATGIDEKITTGKTTMDTGIEAITALTTIATDMAAKQSHIMEELDSAAKYRRALDQSLANYEASLKSITATIGDALGKMVDLHMQNATNAMAEGISANLRQSAAAQMELFNRLETLFAGLEEQSKYQTGLLVSLKDSIEN